MAIEFGDENITISTVLDLARFATAMGGLSNLSLEKPIQDEKKNILIQAKRPLRENIVTALEEREKKGQLAFILENSSQLKSYVASQISLDIQKKLTLSDYGFASWLLSHKDLDIYQVLRSSLNNDFFFIFLCRMLFENMAIRDHLTEVAILSTGLFAEASRNQYKSTDLNTIFITAFLHDYSLVSDPYWGEKDIFPSDGHDRESASLLSAKKLPAGSVEMIRESNNLGEQYHSRQGGPSSTDTNWYPDMTALGGAVLNITEFFLRCRREVATQSGFAKQDLSEVVYLLSFNTENGAFPKPLLRIFQRHFEKYRQFFNYGQKISEIEHACLFEKFALAYPKPMATQVLCRDHHQKCPWRLHSNRITVVQNLNKVVTRYGVALPPGEYDKYRLSEELPNPPFEI